MTSLQTDAATSGSHTFPVEILSADKAPRDASRIPNREVVNQRRTRLV